MKDDDVSIDTIDRSMNRSIRWIDSSVTGLVSAVQTNTRNYLKNKIKNKFAVGSVMAKFLNI